jgi:hypothetical protein
MKKRNRRNVRPLSLELLESRMPLAGDISVQVSGGNLIIKGDNGDNDIAIVQTAAGEFTITGNDGEQFKVNGAAAVAGPVNVTGVTKDIKIDLKKGDDSVALTGLGVGTVLAKNVQVNTGAGADVVLVSSGDLSGKLQIDTHASDKPTDNDDVDIVDLTVARNVSVNTGKGDDDVLLSGGSVAGSVFIKTGHDNDEVIVENAQQVTGKLYINTGDGKGGGDIVRIRGASVVSGNLNIHTGKGDDLVEIDEATGAKVTIDLGAGNDTLNIAAVSAVTVDQALISLGKGDDNVVLGVGTLALLGPNKSRVKGGLGNDTITGVTNLTAGSVDFLVDPLTTAVETVA